MRIPGEQSRSQALKRFTELGAPGDRQIDIDWLWYIKGSLPEAIAATSFAIEGVTGDIARKVTAGFERYKGQPGVDLGPKTYRWMREHAEYDDDHPKIALDIVVRYANAPQLQKRVTDGRLLSLAWSRVHYPVRRIS